MCQLLTSICFFRFYFTLLPSDTEIFCLVCTLLSQLQFCYTFFPSACVQIIGFLLINLQTFNTCFIAFFTISSGNFSSNISIASSFIYVTLSCGNVCTHHYCVHMIFETDFVLTVSHEFSNVSKATTDNCRR